MGSLRKLRIRHSRRKPGRQSAAHRQRDLQAGRSRLMFLRDTNVISELRRRDKADRNRLGNKKTT
jgi:hypothetical protein